MDMGAQNKRFGKVGNMIDAEKAREQEQLRIDEEKDIEERRKHGQFATPFSLAREIISYGLDLLDENVVSFLEPSLGTGVFYSALLHETSVTGKIIKQATGIEIDTTYFNSAKSIWNDKCLQVYNADFTHFPPDGNYNLLIANARSVYGQTRKNAVFMRVSRHLTDFQFSQAA